MGIPILAFVMDDLVFLEDHKMESDKDKAAKLDAFRQEAMSNELACVWTSSEDLLGKIAITVMKAKTQMKRNGWQRACDYDEASLRKEIMDAHATTDEMRKKAEVLSQQLEAANKKIEKLDVQEDLVFDESDYVLKYHYFVKTGGISEKYSGEKSVKLSEIFLIVATALLNLSLNEQALDIIIREKCFGTARTYILDDIGFVKRTISQMQTLNLIRSHLNEDNSLEYWALTSKGRRIRENMMQT
jgi:hypothetical protein